MVGDSGFMTAQTNMTDEVFADSKSGPKGKVPHPLADRLRPGRLSEVIGQTHLLGPGRPLATMVETGSLPSLVFWGPPGVGKTTLARILATETGLRFVQISAVFSGVGELRKVFSEAREHRSNGSGTLLFVDEIHRFNKAQQDSFLHLMEDGTITLVGATTENPSFELNAALMSRAQVLVLERLSLDELDRLARRAENDAARDLPLTDGARSSLLAMADGDGRAAPQSCRTVLFMGGRGETRQRRSHTPAGFPGSPLRQVGRGALQPDFRTGTSRFAAPIRMLRCTGCRGCCPGAKTRDTCAAG